MDLERLLEIITNEPAATTQHRTQAAERLVEAVAAPNFDTERRWRYLDAIIEPLVALTEDRENHQDIRERADRLLIAIERLEQERQEQEATMSVA